MRQTIAETNFQGGLFSLPAGDVRAAIGASYRELDYEFLNDTLTTALLSDLTEGERWDGFWSSSSDGYYVRCTRTGGAIEWFKLADDEPVAVPPRSETRVIALHPKSRPHSRVNVVIAQSPGGRRMLVGSARRTSR